jgi:nitrite reductase/ring-hydroxylating ferredoxin subunit
MTAMTWVRIDPGGLEVGRVTTVVAGNRAICLTRTDDGYGALDNRCPHQGGPLGDGQLEGGYVICPWHAYEYDPRTGTPPEGFADAATGYRVEARDDGLYVEVPLDEPRRSLMTRSSMCCATGGSTRSSAWSGTRTWAWPTPCGSRPRTAG